VDVPAREYPRETLQRNGPLILRQWNVRELSGSIPSQIDIFLIRLPSLAALRQKTAQVQRCVLVRRAAGRVGVIVVQYAKVRTGFRPDVVRLGRMNVGVIPIGSR